MTLVTDLAKTIRRLVTSPLHELNRMQRITRNAVDLARHCARTLARDRAPQMVAALTYRTIFSLVPTIVLAVLVFKAFIQLESAEAEIQEIVYKVLNVEAVGQSATASGDDPRTQIDQRIAEFTENAYSLNFKNIGGVGLLLLIWGALALMITIEQCFNRIYNAPSGRSWHQRIMLYWGVLTLGPVLLAVSFYLMKGLAQRDMGFAPIERVVDFFGRFAIFGVRWLLLLLLYRLMPNAVVRLRPALVGSLVAAILWSLGQWGFALYVRHAVSYSKLYGSLGLIPLFLFWLYLSWFIVLFGLELTYTLQTLRGWQLKQDEALRETELRIDPRWLIPMMAQIGGAFSRGGTTDTQSLADSLSLPANAVRELGRQLEEAGLINQVQRNNREQAFALAMPPEKITIGQLIELGGRLRDQPKDTMEPAFVLLDDLTNAQKDTVRNRTLLDLVDNGEGSRVGQPQ